MGQFSWITQDTHEPIREKYGCGDKSKTTAYMHDHLGNVWEEKDYEGYGEFGGKDFYELLAEMNNLDSDRSLGIELYHSDKPFISPNLTRYKNWKWINKTPLDDPNQGWGNYEEEEDNSLNCWFDEF